MPKCVTCNSLLHTNLCFIINETGEEIQYQCYFCKLGLDKLTTINDKTKKEKIIYKKQAIKNYKMYLKDLSENNKKIKKVIQGNYSNRIITP